jgi:tRNA A-37 threonylcarbamoyl transferase component Bud32
MDCLEHSLVVDYVEGRLAPDVLAQAAEHIDRCSYCRKQVALTAASSSTSPARPPLPALKIGRYRLLEPIGAGGMGVVYAARDPELDRKVAVKVMRSDRRRNDEELRPRLLREAHAMARLSHPNVITVYDVGTFEGSVFIAMEFVDGGTLSSWIMDRRPWRTVIDVFERAGRGLEAAHQAGLVHRDFKPDNVLVGRDGRVRVTDFGLARLAGEVVSDSGELTVASPLRLSLTGTGALLGTPAYMAPEQMRGESTDARADVFSFSVALYEALYGERPYVGSTLAALCDAVAHSQVSDAPAGSHVPSAVRRVLLVGLKALPEERYSTMGALLEALKAATRPPRRRPLYLAGAGLVLAAVGAAAWLGRPAPQKVTAMAAPPPSAPIAAPAPAPAAPPGLLVVRLKAGDGRIELDGNLLAEAASGARISVDATREHLLHVSAPGYRPYQKRIMVGPGAIVETDVTLAKAAAAAPATARRPAPPRAIPAAPAPPADEEVAIDPYR